MTYIDHAKEIMLFIIYFFVQMRRYAKQIEIRQKSRLKKKEFKFHGLYLDFFLIYKFYFFVLIFNKIDLFVIRIYSILTKFCDFCIYFIARDRKKFLMFNDYEAILRE